MVTFYARALSRLLRWVKQGGGMDGWGLQIGELEDEEKSNVIFQTLAQTDRVPGPAFDCL
jgi:hypothetical protein